MTYTGIHRIRCVSRNRWLPGLILLVRTSGAGLHRLHALALAQHMPWSPPQLEVVNYFFSVRVNGYSNGGPHPFQVESSPLFTRPHSTITVTSGVSKYRPIPGAGSRRK